MSEWAQLAQDMVAALQRIADAAERISTEVGWIEQHLNYMSQGDRDRYGPTRPVRVIPSRESDADTRKAGA